MAGEPLEFKKVLDQVLLPVPFLIWALKRKRMRRVNTCSEFSTSFLLLCFRKDTSLCKAHLVFCQKGLLTMGCC